MIWINILIGLILLIAGRRLFWLFVACVAFASGYHYAQQMWSIHSPVLVIAGMVYEAKTITGERPAQ
jgi:hypothetical protein